MLEEGGWEVFSSCLSQLYTDSTCVCVKIDVYVWCVCLYLQELVFILGVT